MAKRYIVPIVVALALVCSMTAFSAPVQAALYQPGTTLDPSCIPTDPTCGIATTTSSVGAGLQGQIPYYAANGSLLVATSSISILQNGNVGFGTTSPSKNLVVDSSSLTGTTIRLSNSSAGAHVYDLLTTGSGNSGGAGRLDIFDNTAGVARLSIGSGGYVGIGTTTPSAPLAVNGSGYFTGALNVGDALTTRNNLGLSYATFGQVASSTSVQIATWGDSLTAGVGADPGQDYPSDLAQITGYQVYNGGVSGDTTAQIEQRMTSNTTETGWPTIIWAGRNDIVNGNISQVEANIALMVSHLTTQNYMILSVFNLNTETSGTSGYNTVIALNNYLASTYGSHYLDVRSYMVSQYNPSLPQDVTDHSNDVLPTSLRYDTVHLNDAGYLILAQYIAAHASGVLYSTTTSPGTYVLTTSDLASLYNNPQRFSFLDVTDGYYLNGTELLSASSSLGSTVVGYKAAPWAIGTSTPTYTTAVGDHALYFSANSGTAIDNTALGYSAIYANKTGANNTGVGYSALRMNTSGSFNNAFGSSALFNTTTGTGDIGIGSNVLYTNTTGSDNDAMGYASLYTTNGSQNVALGSDVLRLNTTGSNNVGVGYSALWYNLSATSTVAIGNQAAIGSTTGYYNQGGTYVGAQAGYSAYTGSDYNTFLGFRSGYYVTTGKDNIIVGAAYGPASNENLTTGSYNIKIGGNISFPSATASNQLDIGNILYGTNVSGTAQTVAGSIGIGTSTPYSRLTLWGPDTAAGTAAFTIANNASTTEFQVFDNGTATLAGTLTQNSDQRLKTNIQSLDGSSTLAAILSLNPVTFNWRDTSIGGGQQLGFIAQDVQQIFPQLVSTTSPTALTPGGTLGVNYIGLIAPAIEAIKELAAEVNGFAQSFTSQNITAKQQLCVGATCITETQLKTLLQQSGQTPAAPTAPSSTPDDSSASTDSTSSSTPSDSADTTFDSQDTASTSSADTTVAPSNDSSDTSSDTSSAPDTSADSTSTSSS